ncbi:glycosyltransferase [Gluconacetobacter johannae DSM 13595]|uniref:Glycosyltransferase n=3 Tax=Gluconacetobacter johannae TaxID=112140 RepID=A0A7W4J5M4_9PROT|nr:glycosyltransferase [Gluconacetobacter johannae]GBQ87106.1 glycosyltransferase [Gluconacetobacter johannae DSM 13595]
MTIMQPDPNVAPVMKVAIVHEWLEHFAGSERVVEQLLLVFPQAELFAIVDFMPASDRGMLAGRKVTTTFIQRLPFARRLFRNYIGLMPIAVEQLDLAGFDLIISSNHAVAKGVITGPDQIHVSYVHSPMRYAWDMQAAYLRQGGMERGLKGLFARWLLHRLRNWDVRSASGVDMFVANSHYIRRRIRKVYRREAAVIYPPVDITRFQVVPGPRDAYVVVSRLVPYKRVDLVVEAFRRMPHRTLVVVGDGPERERIAALASGAPNITMRGKVPHDELLALMQGARAFVFAAEEDFGIAMVEAQACGTPLIAFGRGGALDIVRGVGDAGGPTGLLFDCQTSDAIVDAVERFTVLAPLMTPELCRANALRFSEEAFRDSMRGLVEQVLSDDSRAARTQPATRDSD